MALVGEIVQMEIEENMKNFNAGVTDLNSGVTDLNPE